MCDTPTTSTALVPIGQAPRGAASPAAAPPVVDNTSFDGTPADSYAGMELEVIAGFKVHPMASKFPLIVGKEFDELVEAAARAGRLYPVETHQGLLIDGRNRLRAQEELHRRGIEIEVPVVEWEPTGDETVEEHIWSVNENRRHETPDQRVVLALEFLPVIRAARQARQDASRFGKNEGDAAAVIPTPPGGQAEIPGRTSKEKDAASTAGGLASLAGVSIYKARQATALHKAVEAGEASEAELDAVLAGDLSLSDALPKRKKGGAKSARHDDWDEGDDDLTVDATPVPSEAEAHRLWRAITSDFAVADLAEWRRLFMKVIRDEQQTYER
jgi:hypothetical protein